MVRPLLAALVGLALVAGCGGNPAREARPGKTPTASPTASTTTPAPTKKTKKPAPKVSVSVPPALRGGGDPDREILGADASWPQCPKGMGIKYKQGFGAPMPLETAKYVVLGLTNGPGFHPNPCLKDQVGWVKERRLLAAAYSVVSYPDAAELRTYGGQGPFRASSLDGRLQNVGYQQAVFNIQTMRNAGLTVGIYSTPALWKRVVGDLRLGVPEWRAAGQTSRAEARSRCGSDWVIQGGVAVLSQWVEQGRDQNITCRGTAAQMQAWFHQY